MGETNKRKNYTFMHEANNPIIITVSNNIKNIEGRSAGARNSASFMNDYAYRIPYTNVYVFSYVLCIVYCVSDERMNGAKKCVDIKTKLLKHECDHKKA